MKAEQKVGERPILGLSGFLSNNVRIDDVNHFLENARKTIKV